MKVKRLIMSAEFFFGLITDGFHPAASYSVVSNAVPEDAKLVNVRHGWPNQIELLIASETFEEVREGDEIPILTPICQTVQRAA